MRALLIPAAIALSIASAPLALAANQQATGAIKTFDQKAMTLTLADGATYKLPANFKNPGLKTGEKVQISWNMKDGQHIADSVKVVQ